MRAELIATLLAEGFNKRASEDDAAGMLYYCPDDDTVMLVKRSDEMKHPGTWSLPGGRSEDGESPKETAEREAEEELGELPDATFVRKHVTTVGDEGHDYHVFIHTMDAHQKARWEPELDDENSKYRWYPIEDLPEKTHFDLDWVNVEIRKVKKAASLKRTASLAKIAIQTFKPRYEHKYLIPLSAVRHVRAYIKPFVTADDYGQFYPVKNIYLDNDQFSFYRAHRAGSDDRFKLRIRSYETCDTLFLEVKRKVNGMIRKQRTILSPDLYRNAQALQDVLFIQLAEKNRCRPVVAINYDREAYDDGNGGRVTVDSNVRYAIHGTYDFDASPNIPVIPDGVGILELKFSGKAPEFMDRLVQDFGLRKSSVSKYCLALDPTVGSRLEEQS
jgi:8-oxo-dGTP pyrophosphatase MutT (NUDIX family)